MATPEDIQLAKIREDGKTARQQNLIALVGNILNVLVGLLNTYLLVANHSDTVSKVGEVKVEARAASLNAGTAVRIAKEESSELKERVDATNLQWKAYNTKKDEDIHMAANALQKVDPMAAKPNPE